MINFFKTYEDKFLISIEKGSLEDVKSFLFSKKSNKIQDVFPQALISMFKYNRLDVFSWVIENTIITDNIREYYVTFLEQLFEEKYDKAIPFISLLFTHNYDVSNKRRKRKYAPRKLLNFSKSFIFLTIDKDKTKIFDHLMSQDLNFHFNSNELFEYARINNHVFLRHLFKQKELLNAFKEEYNVQFKEFKEYLQYSIAPKLEDF
jgi:hypothetical protein